MRFPLSSPLGGRTMVGRDRQAVVGEEDFTDVPWGDALKHAPAVLALAALVIYGYLSICYDAFYRALGVDPGDVGLSYAAILARSSGFVIAACFLLLIAAALLIDPPTRAELRHPVAARLISAAAGLISFASRWLAVFVVGTMFLLVFTQAEDAARDVRAGNPVRPLHPPSFASIPLVILAIRADPATVEPAGKPGDSPAADRLRGRRLLYLGQADGTVVLYDAAAQRAVYVPASAMIL